MKTLSVVLALGLALPASAQQAGAAADFTRKAGQWMMSTEASKRQAAYRTWMQMGPDAMDDYEKSLGVARKAHSAAIDKLCATSGRSTNPYLEHLTVAEELDAERDRVMPLIRTDWKKEPKKIAMLREEMENLTVLHEKAVRIAKADTTKLDATVNSHLDALAEIAREMERFDDTLSTSEMDDDALRQFVLEDHFEASHLMKARERFIKTRDAHAKLEETTETNRKLGGWCSGAMQNFTEILNGERAVLGLPPLRIEEKLSAAAEGHSKDMARLGFFAHESPVPEKKTPWDRARKAGFQGQASGENIFMGSTSPQAAYNGWFASDGHRFIMMASGPNVIGVGIAGKHWTMMTGRQ
ncbi:CAP domain-containing protein [Haloferula rosea]|uniref:CAP domain-containing protein n=1 Tax=Haloferula rosea TaxID=490093 RepID=A0A934VH37_9BACT|nr:CAP domain-containing protein [Haloferula rosea]MBK1828676.1 CAP domain-containing protein [Haloferula rosea]